MLRHKLEGFLVSFALWIAAYQLGFVTALGPARLLNIDEYWLGFWVSLLLALFYGNNTPSRWLQRLALSVGVIYIVVAFTPLVKWPIRAWLYHDADEPSDALVVLSAGSTAQGAMDTSGLERLVSALAEVADHMPAALVVTELPTSTDTDIRRDQQRLIRDFTAHWFPPLEHYGVGPVASTYDEARKTKELAQQNGWKKITLVTSPMHMRRAAATFRKVGLNIVARPSVERFYSVPQLTSPRDRLYAFKDLMTEIAGYTLYLVRGRV